MVTKHLYDTANNDRGLILAKIHMVTKLNRRSVNYSLCLILAKIHMVTKPNAISVVNPYLSYSSKNPYGNKTTQEFV